MESSLGGFLPMPNRSKFETKGSDGWLAAKKDVDGAEGLWRINEDLYDLTDFINKHPGGKDWLIATRDTDITEAFECHHPRDTSGAHPLLKKLWVRKAARSKRNSPFTFKEDGFYRTLKRRVQPILAEIKDKPGIPMRKTFDGLLLTWTILLLLTGLSFFGSISYYLAALAGIICGMNTIAAHNYFHRADNWRQYMFDVTGLSSYEWRISHGLSHHLYPNTVWDVEISALEPVLNFLPSPKNFAQRYLVIIYSHLIYPLVLPVELLKRVVDIVRSRRKFRIENLLIVIPYILLYISTGNALFAWKLWMTFIAVCSYWFAFVGLSAAHHSPDNIWHDGDAYPIGEDRDWGAFQLHAVQDREYVNGKNGSIFLVGTFFGDHLLHHLFPTVDHSHLSKMYPALEKTIQDFGFSYDFTSMLSLVVGKYRQLSRVQPATVKQKRN